MSDYKSNDRFELKAEMQQHMRADDFAGLLKHFNNSTCVDDSYAVATWMFSRFPNEAKALLPKVKGEDLNYDGNAQGAGRTGEWAALLTTQQWAEKNAIAHNQLKPNAKVPVITREMATEEDFHAAASKLYTAKNPPVEVGELKPLSTPVKSGSCTIIR